MNTSKLHYKERLHLPKQQSGLAVAATQPVTIERSKDLLYRLSGGLLLLIAIRVALLLVGMNSDSSFTAVTDWMSLPLAILFATAVTIYARVAWRVGSLVRVDLKWSPKS